jgi:hypothetical protein
MGEADIKISSGNKREEQFVFFVEKNQSSQKILFKLAAGNVQPANEKRRRKKE